MASNNNKLWFKFVSLFVTGCLVALAFQVYLYSPLTSPQILHFPTNSPFDSLLPPNSLLQGLTKIGEGFVKGPEDVCVDKDGVMYTAGRDGWIKRWQTNNNNEEDKEVVLENWKWVNSSNLLGLTITAAGDLILCDAQEGLLKVNEHGVTTLVSHFNGTKLRLTDDVIEGKDGSLYFSVASSKYGLHEWYLDILEARPHGKLLKYNPNTKKTTLLIDNLGFANGVALSKDQDYLLICETWKSRCLKYWLQGDLKGRTDIFLETLPGAPDNINLAPDGSFWIALLQMTTKGMEFVHSSKMAKHILATFPGMIKVVLGTDSRSTVLKVAPNGTLLKRFDDPNGKVISFVTSAMEHDDNLYLGSLGSNFVGKIPLT